MIRLPWFRQKTRAPEWAGDPTAWAICWEEGHVSVSDIESWLCVRCWTWFYMGMGSSVKEEMREGFRTGEWLIWQTPAMWHFGKAEWNEGKESVSLVERLGAGPDMVPPSKGGPPYTFEIKVV